MGRLLRFMLVMFTLGCEAERTMVALKPPLLPPPRAKIEIPDDSAFLP